VFVPNVALICSAGDEDSFTVPSVGGKYHERWPFVLSVVQGSSEGRFAGATGRCYVALSPGSSTSPLSWCARGLIALRRRRWTLATSWPCRTA